MISRNKDKEEDDSYEDYDDDSDEYDDNSL